MHGAADVSRCSIGLGGGRKNRKARHSLRFRYSSLRRASEILSELLKFMEHRVGIEPTNTGFADQRVSHFATGAHIKQGIGNRE